MKVSEDKATDMQLVLELIKHIENPCTVEVEGKTRNIRNFYLGEAKKQISKLDNPYARDMLRDVINKYRE